MTTKVGIKILLHFSTPFSTPNITTAKTRIANINNQNTGCTGEAAKPVKYVSIIKLVELLVRYSNKYLHTHPPTTQ